MCCTFSIDPDHKSHNVSDRYPTMHHLVTEMCTYVHISVTKWCIVGYGTGALWNLCDRSIRHIFRAFQLWGICHESLRYILCSLMSKKTLEFYQLKMIFNCYFRLYIRICNNLLCKSKDQGSPFLKIITCPTPRIWNSLICLYEIKKKNLSKFTCPGLA